MQRFLLLVALLAVPVSASAGEAPDSTDLTSLGLEGLMQLEVTSVSRHEEPLFRAASAITVLTADDITRSGATNIPDLLRGVPGLNVAQINSNTWAVSARGFGGQYANKLLVLVDGRTIYDPIFSGVHWDVVDVLLEDVQRIEIIRGPGATAWGANAVNGVINIISKPANSEPGWLVIAGAGTHSNAIGALRYAGPAGKSADFRLSAKYHNVGRLDDVDGNQGHDDLELGQLGGRYDWNPGGRDKVTVQGDYYGGQSEERAVVTSLDPPYSSIVDTDAYVRGGNVLASWLRTFSAKSDFRLQAYYDHFVRPGSYIQEDAGTLDIDFQHRLAIGDRNDVMWGGGYRVIETSIGPSPGAYYDPADRTSRLGNLFVQDAIALVPNRVTLTIGSKFEHNDFSGLEIEPSARLLWSASPTQTVWSSYSRAVRTPGPTDEDVNIDQSVFPLGGGAVGVARIIGADLVSETMTSFEFGYRAQIRRELSVDLAGFESWYEHLRSVEPGAPFPESDPAPAHMVFPQYFANGFHGRTRGLEGTLEWRPVSRFELTVSHSLFWMRLEPNAGATGNPDVSAADTPTYQLFVQPHVALTSRLSLDANWNHVDDLPAQHAPAYDRVGARLGWKASPRLEVSAGVQNVFHDRELEFRSTSGTNAATTVRTGAYGKVTWSL